MTYQNRRSTRSFEAMYGGRCGVCDTRIDPGDQCCYFDDEVCHHDCALEEMDG